MDKHPKFPSTHVWYVCFQHVLPRLSRGALASDLAGSWLSPRSPSTTTASRRFSLISPTRRACA